MRCCIRSTGFTERCVFVSPFSFLFGFFTIKTVVSNTPSWVVIIFDGNLPSTNVSSEQFNNPVPYFSKLSIYLPSIGFTAKHIGSIEGFNIGVLQLEHFSINSFFCSSVLVLSFLII